MRHARKKGLGEAVGLTLSREQEVAIAKAAIPDVKVHYMDWREFESARRFDIVTSVESIEAFVRPNMSREQRDGSLPEPVRTLPCTHKFWRNLCHSDDHLW